MVVTFLPCTCETAIWHERVALPSTCTVHVPHRPEPQPNFVPVSLRCSRSTHSSGVSGSAATLTALSLTVNAIVMFPPCETLWRGRRERLKRPDRACHGAYAAKSGLLSGSLPAP